MQLGLQPVAIGSRWVGTAAALGDSRSLRLIDLGNRGLNVDGSETIIWDNVCRTFTATDT